MQLLKLPQMRLAHCRLMGATLGDPPLPLDHLLLGSHLLKLLGISEGKRYRWKCQSGPRVAGGIVDLGLASIDTVAIPITITTTQPCPFSRLDSARITGLSK